MAAAWDPAPSDNLYMKGLPPGIAEETLVSLFSAYGTVTSCKVLPCPPGVTDSAALVRMGNSQEAQWLLDQAPNIGAALGSPVQMRFANNPKMAAGDLSSSAIGFKGAPMMTHGTGGPGMPSNRLYMKGFPPGLTDEQLRAIMSSYGVVTSSKVLAPPPGGALDSACILQMATVQEAQWLVENLDGNIPQGLTSPIQVKFKDDGFTVPSTAVVPASAEPPIPDPPTTPPPSHLMGQHSGYSACPSPPMGPPQPPTGNSRYISNNLCIRGLPAGMTDETVVAVFGAYGTVLAASSIAAVPGHSGPAHLVSMGTLEEAKWLVYNLHGNIPQGMTDPVTVRYAIAVVAPAPPRTGPGTAPSSEPSRSIAADDGNLGEPCDNLYVKGLPGGFTDETLVALFSSYGRVTRGTVLPSSPGVAHTAALVRMASVQEAKWLVDNLHGNIPEGLGDPVYIKFANNSRRSADAGNALPSATTQTPLAAQPSEHLYMKGFPVETTEESLRAILGPYGTLISIRLLPATPGASTVAAFVQMGSLDEAQWLVDNLDGNIPQGQTFAIEVRFASPGGTAADLAAAAAAAAAQVGAETAAAAASAIADAAATADAAAAATATIPGPAGGCGAPPPRYAPY